MLVGSDGIRSAVRRSMYTALADAERGERAEKLRTYIEPVWSGSVAYRGLIPAGKLPEEYLKEGTQASIVSANYLRRVAPQR